MSKVTIEIPDNRWFRGEWAHRPKDGELVLFVKQNFFGEYLLLVGEYHDEKVKCTHCNVVSEWSHVELWTPIGMIEDIMRLLHGPQEE